MRNVSVKQIMSHLSVTTCMERSVRFLRRPRIFEVHTVNEEGGEDALGAGDGRGGDRVGQGRRGEVRRVVERVCGIAEYLGEGAG